MKVKKIAIVGNPNVGKSTLFNRLTGGAQKIGNWPGKTVEIKEGVYRSGEKKVRIIDLPGVYSLSSNSPEEIVANKYISEKKPDVIIHIADSTNLERNLYLTMQLLEKKQNVVLALNMSDVTKRKGIEIDEKKISGLLGIRAVKISAKCGDGIKELMDECMKSKARKKPAKDAVKAEHEISAKERYALIAEVAQKTIKKPLKIRERSRKIDGIVMNKWLAIPIFIFVMWAVFQLTFTLAAPFMDIIDSSFAQFGGFAVQALESAGLGGWAGSLFSEGIVGGVGAVLMFLPTILILFFLLLLLEDTGYFARIAVIMDGLMQKIGLEGKAFIPLVLGFGCNVPAIMATRILEDEKERLIAILINPLMSCSARLPIYTLFVGVFFAQNQGLVLLSIYLTGIVLAIIVAYVLSRVIFRKKNPPHLLIELPPYRIPCWESVLRQTFEKGMQFVKKAGGVILTLSILIWFLASMPFGVEYASKQSYIGMVGGIVAPIFEPCGFGNWESAVSLFFGAMAKEVVVSTMGVLYGAEEGALGEIIANKFTPLSAYAFMIFSLVYMPCIAAIAAIRNETKSWKWALFAIGYTLALAWILACAIYQIGMALGFG
ncbi:MAG: ferrous iron transport protein B [Candidatus Micrarchaeota archaeon]